MKVGEVYTQRELLDLTLIESANNYSSTLAKWAFGSEDAFVAKAREWVAAHDLPSITIVDSTGLGAGNVGTATDVIELGRLALADPLIAAIVGTGFADHARRRAGREHQRAAGHRRRHGHQDRHARPVRRQPAVLGGVSDRLVQRHGHRGGARRHRSRDPRRRDHRAARVRAGRIPRGRRERRRGAVRELRDRVGPDGRGRGRCRRRCC